MSEMTFRVIEDAETPLAEKILRCPIPEPTLHGLEYEFQLVYELDGQMQTVRVLHLEPLVTRSHKNVFFRYRDYHGSEDQLIPDMGNIEIRTAPWPFYQEALEEAETLLNKKLIPILAKQLNKFALFLPAVMSTNVIKRRIVCTKHWNISNFKWNSENFSTLIKPFEGLNYSLTVKYGNCKGYWHQSILTGNVVRRIHIQLPYHYTPPLLLKDLPSFNDIIIPPDHWRPLVGYYKNGRWTQVRRLC